MLDDSRVTAGWESYIDLDPPAQGRSRTKRFLEAGYFKWMEIAGSKLCLGSVLFTDKQVD